MAYGRAQEKHEDLRLALRLGDPALIAKTSNPLAVAKLAQLQQSLTKQQAMIAAVNRSAMTDEEKLKYVDGLTEGLTATAKAGTNLIRAIEGVR